MKLVIFSYSTLFLLFFSCGNTPQEEALRLCNKAVFLIANNPDTTKVLKAIQLLDKATDIQPDYYVAYDNKFAFQCELDLIDDAFCTLKNMERLKPESPDLKTTLGAFYEYYKKDTIRAMNKYNEANLLYKLILDTLNPDFRNYEFIITDYAFNLKLLKEDAEANQVLHDCFGNDIKDFIDTFMVKRTREEVLKWKYFTPNGIILGGDVSN